MIRVQLHYDILIKNSGKPYSITPQWSAALDTSNREVTGCFLGFTADKIVLQIVLQIDISSSYIWYILQVIETPPI